MTNNLIYQIYPIAFIKPQFRGDERSALKKITDFLPRLEELNIRYLWLSPLYPSPWFDHGYDVADYRGIDPRFGNMREFEELVNAASSRGIGILMDLVLNHTSTEHIWFTNQQNYYCWSVMPRPGWVNLFDGGSCWTPDPMTNQYYLHLFHEEQADLNWYPNGPDSKPNPELIEEFQRIVDFWVKKGVAGFRLDIPQCINKDLSKEEFNLVPSSDAHHLHMAADVISEIFNQTRADLFLLMECFDLTGKMCAYYYEHTPIKAIMDITVKRSARDGLDIFIKSAITAYTYCPDGYAHATESHDAPRFTSATGIDGKTAIDFLFGYHEGKRFINPHHIVIYQGQELGLENPSTTDLTDEEMLELDAEAKMRYKHGEPLDKLRPTSRANARVMFPLNEYRRQEKHSDSCLSHTEMRITEWYINYLFSGIT